MTLRIVPGVGKILLSPGMVSACPGPEEHSRDRLEQDSQIKPDRPVVDIFQIKFYPGLKFSDVIAPAYLPEASDARLDA